jgi:hypothetical protein
MVELVERMRYRSRMRGGFVVRYGSAHFRSRKHKNPLFACARTSRAACPSVTELTLVEVLSQVLSISNLEHTDFLCPWCTRTASDASLRDSGQRQRRFEFEDDRLRRSPCRGGVQSSTCRGGAAQPPGHCKSMAHSVVDLWLRECGLGVEAHE